MAKPDHWHFSFSIPWVWFKVAGSILLLIPGALSIGYLLSPYSLLANRYLPDESCIYQQAFWRETFFTASEKAEGNLIALAALVAIGFLSVVLLSRTYPSIRTQLVVPKGSVLWREYGLNMILILFASLLWYWGFKDQSPSTDEVFSARFFASVSPFYAWSHYPLPNNHILFNLVNGTLFFWWEDKILSGRVLSLLAYYITAITVFKLFKQWKVDPWLALMMACVIILQFSTWGFAFQARGYAWQITMAYLVVYLLIQYMERPQPRRLFLLAICTMAGYALLPSFLYFHAGLLTTIAIQQGWERKWDLNFWLSQFLTFAGVFLFYLPGLLFSGLDAFIANRYVEPKQVTIHTFAGSAWQILKSYPVWLSSFPNSVALVFTGLPFLLLPFLGKQAQRISLFLWFQVLVLVLLILLMRRYPFHRNLAPQFSLFFMGALWTISLVINRLLRVWSRNKAGFRLSMLVLLTVIGSYLFRTNPDRLERGELYFDNLPPFIQHIQETLEVIPENQRVGISDEAFYWGYWLKRAGHQVESCGAYDPDWYIAQTGENIPESILEHFELKREVADYVLFQRK